MKPPNLQSGRVYRTADFARFDKNPTRLVGRLVRSGRLRPLRKGLYHAPETSAFGDVPPSEDELLRAFFRGRPFLRTGPSVWNRLGLGSTAVEAVPLVYNKTRSGTVEMGGRRFELRRVRFARRPDPEFFVIDLLENTDRAGVDFATLRRALSVALQSGRFHAERLRDRAGKYGSPTTQRFVHELLG